MVNNLTLTISMHDEQALCAYMQFVQVKRRDFAVTTAMKSGEVVCDAHFKHKDCCSAALVLSIQSTVLSVACL